MGSDRSGIMAALLILAAFAAGFSGGDGPPKRLVPPAAVVPKELPPKAAPKSAPPKAAAEAPKEEDAAQADVPESKLASQALATPSKAAGIELSPDKATIPSSKRFQIVTAKADGKVKWLVFNKGKDPVEWLELPGTRSIQVFPNYGQDDVITVYAYTAVAGAPSDPVKSVITVGKEAKAPPKGDLENPEEKPKETPKEMPKETPKGSSTKLHMTLITDESLTKANPALAKLIISPDLRSGVEGRGHKLWIMDQKRDLDKIKKAGFDEYVRKIGKLPLYVIQDDQGAVADSGLMPLTLVAALQKLDAIIPPKDGADGNPMDGDSP